MSICRIPRGDDVKSSVSDVGMALRAHWGSAPLFPGQFPGGSIHSVRVGGCDVQLVLGLGDIFHCFLFHGQLVPGRLECVRVCSGRGVFR